MLLHQQSTKHEQIKRNIFINWHDHTKIKNYRKKIYKKNLNIQCLQFFVNIFFIDKKYQHFVENQNMNKRNWNKTHFVKGL